MIFSMGEGQLDLVSHSLIVLPVILFRVSPKYSYYSQGLSYYSLSGDSCDSTITLKHNMRFLYDLQKKKVVSE